MAELSWKEAIIKVLEQSKAEGAMHYADIAQEIATLELKKKFGATPAATVSSIITTSLKDEGEKSPFVKVSRGYYTLRQMPKGRRASEKVEPLDETAQAGFINAFGMYWQRAKINWAAKVPILLGQQQVGSESVDFCEEIGVYLLHDGSKVVYVGRTTDRPLGIRLKEHTTDRLNGRWDRFSWFGIYRVNEKGGLDKGLKAKLDVSDLIATMEALLIEGVEPSQNRRRGDDFGAVEFIQVEDPEIEKIAARKFLDDMKKKL